MKRLAVFLLAMACVLMVVGCTPNVGNVKNVRVGDYHSDIYTDAEIESAIGTAINYFQKQFDGCTLTEITYIGDAELGNWKEFAERRHADEVIVLVSSFDVDASGGDGSLNPNSTYTNWKWILVRNQNGNWTHADHGY